MPQQYYSTESTVPGSFRVGRKYINDNERDNFALWFNEQIKLYRELDYKFHGDAIAVYASGTKEIIKKASVFPELKIEITGMPRSDHLYNTYHKYNSTKNKVKKLKNKPELIPTKESKFIVRQFAHSPILNRNIPRGRAIEAPQKVQESRLPASGPTDNGRNFIRRKSEIDSIDRRNNGFSHDIPAGQFFGNQKITHGRTS